LPPLWLAASLGLARLARWPLLRRSAAAALVVVAAGMYRLDSPLPLGSQYEPLDILWSPASRDLSRLGQCIPAQVGAESSKRRLAHLANRRELYVFPPKDYRPGLWPPSNPPAFLLLDLTNQDTLRELDAPSGPIR